ncbi:MAG: arsenic metallochaperone ArsD family protein [Rothia sp. (in: high G+C Gram-positive bacteria)]|nr:arsenic metallochaperone ArsD family protein [Rothia sp. (in: high G+C Gram-positive bacteria)]
MTKTTPANLAELEIFIPGPGENTNDPGDVERTEFLKTAQELLDSGLDIAVYSTDSYPSAFEDCVPVADQIEISGHDVLPILLADGEIKVSYNYPDSEQMKRFSQARAVKPKKISAAAAACGTGGAGLPTTAPAMEPAGFAATLAGFTERPAGGPEIGARRNLMSGDFGDGLPTAHDSAVITQNSTAESNAGGCGCGGCGCQ